MSDDLAILLTPPGAAAIAVVRLSGPGVSSFLAHHFSRRPAPSRCIHGDLFDGDRILDDVIVVLSPDGLTADVNLHGGPWVVRSALDLAARCGFCILNVPPSGPLPPCATDGDTELDREVLMWLPWARTELAMRILLAQPRAWQSLGTLDPDAQRDQAARMLADPSLHWLLNLPRIAIIGAPNVGKSTLANQLFARPRSITADLPGTTRDWVGEVANIDGLAVMLLDTPGLRESLDPIESAAIQRSGEQVRRADLVVLVLDPTRPLEPEQAPLLAAYPDAITVINKSDRPARWPPAQVAGIPTVATTGQGTDDLRRAIRSRFGCDALDLAQPRCWTARQREAMQSILHPDAC